MNSGPLVLGFGIALRALLPDRTHRLLSAFIKQRFMYESVGGFP